MNKTEIITSSQAIKILSEAVKLGLNAKICRMSHGKWIQCTLKLVALNPDALVCDLPDEPQTKIGELKTDQPVGMSFQLEFQKYIFDCTVASTPTTPSSCQICLTLPDRIEKMPRRAYQRQPVPASLNVNVLFWHRGYADDSSETPEENYWQGKLLNLSAGGAGVVIPLELAQNFRPCQLVGLQFTPMSYQKPVLLEGQLVHIQPDPDKDLLQLGIEFLGLEVTDDGRNILHRLMDIVNDYAKQNRT